MNHRPLKTIAAEIATALKREVTNVIEIGGLLAEAQEQLGARGRWLPWLRDNFPLTPRTAQNYMAASAFAREYETVSHSRLTVRGLYALVDANRDGNVQAVGAALAEAKTKSVDDDRVREIIAELQAPAGASDETEPPGEDDDDDDRPFPEPPLQLTPRQAAQLQQFETAGKGLLALKAKPAREFLATAISVFDLETIANFLRQIAIEKSRTT
jgi:hypothetical protein